MWIGVDQHLKFLCSNPAAFEFLRDDRMPDIPMHLQDPNKWLLDGESRNCIIDISFYMEQLMACVNYQEYAATHFPRLFNDVYLPFRQYQEWTRRTTIRKITEDTALGPLSTQLTIRSVD